MLCPRHCAVDRFTTMGVCNSDHRLIVNMHQLHFWEEPVISGTQGSGTIFFSNCNLKCVFCQNYRISQEGCGNEVGIEALVEMMLDLQQSGAHNINLVTPTHYTVQLRDALIMAKSSGLSIPIVWNSNAYEHADTLRLMEGLVDIYLPDFKYAHTQPAALYSGAANYPTFAKSAILEMFRQTGHLKTFEGIAFRGILIRILVLPGQADSLKGILYWIAENLGTKCHVSLLGQYYPSYHAHEFAELQQGLKQGEYQNVVAIAEDLGLENIYLQEVGSSDDYTPDFIQK